MEALPKQAFVRGCRVRTERIKSFGRAVRLAWLGENCVGRTFIRVNTYIRPAIGYNCRKDMTVRQLKLGLAPLPP